jgi:kumamolisin
MRIRVTLHVRRSSDPQGNQKRQFLEAAGSGLIHQPPSLRNHLSRDNFAAQFGVTPADFQQARRFAREYRLDVVLDRLVQETRANQLAHGTLELEGTVGAFNRAFGVDLIRVEDQDGNVYRTYRGPLSIPSEYENVIKNALGLDNRPQADAHFQHLRSYGGYSPRVSGGGYTPVRIAELYNFPADYSGKTQTIGLIELGGGFRRRDLHAYFNALGIPRPMISAVSVGTGSNSPDGPNSADAEVMLDIEVAGAIAPGARIVVYFAPSTSSRAFFRAIKGAIHDNRHKPTIISISWGGAESTWSLRDMHSIDEAFQDAAALGVSVFVAAGDAGSSDGVSPSEAHVDFPASSPFATACGGTRLVMTDPAQIADERVWNDAPDSGTGGGISAVFPVPPYQMGISLPRSAAPGVGNGRGVPDISGNADPVTGYNTRVDGTDTVIGGTSAVAPLWAALFARINEGLGREVGFVNTLLYSAIASAGYVPSSGAALRDVTQPVTPGNDTTGLVGGYPAGPGWDACTGLGTPADGTRMLDILKSL